MSGNDTDKNDRENKGSGWRGWLRRVFSRNSSTATNSNPATNPNLTQPSQSPGSGDTSQRKRQGNNDGNGDASLPKRNRLDEELPKNSESLASRRSLIAEQDIAYQESLRKDREKEEIKKEADKNQREKENEQKAEAEQFERKKAEVLSQISSEPSCNDPDAFPLAIRLPCGSRLQRYFRTSDSAQDVYRFVFSHPNFQLENSETLVLTTGILKSLRISSETEGTLADNGIQSSVTLYVDF